MSIEVHFGDCLQVMESIPDKSVRLICADLPYGVTNNKLDIVIPFAPLWEQYERIIKEDGTIFLFGQGIFSARLVTSNEKLFRYSLIWEKTTPTGLFNVNYQPLRSHEDMHVFYKKRGVYNPQKSTGHKPVNSYTKHTSDGVNYGKGKTGIKGGGSTERFPTSVWKFPTDKQKDHHHPTQKPLALLERIVKTYSNEGDLVMDNTAGSGTTGAACITTNRDCILIDNNPTHIQTIKTRLNL